jgi:hypothetical protein
MADGEKVPLVFFPRFTTLTSAATFWSTPIDMIEFDTFQLTCFRSVITGGGAPTITFYIQHSADLIEWTDLIASFDPSAGDNVAGTVDKNGLVERRYVRVGVALGVTASPSATVFAIGWAARTVTWTETSAAEGRPVSPSTETGRPASRPGRTEEAERSPAPCRDDEVGPSRERDRWGGTLLPAAAVR